ncbi:Integrase, catalytic region (plasmid) [Paraburkholderia phenoliruptrix BR3459a]|uniref:Integrase, catalytic region n=1 Tax=Paraburkholderia phenoliruptrix BR3459a TaxID=1229205 RepID=K0DUQ2_9BURK|nr:Integrase, catalytic region [Paraburkholderia phenoliruptrix BR3459a]
MFELQLPHVALKRLDFTIQLCSNNELPGYLELDFVEHCGGTKIDGDFVHSFVMTDIATRRMLGHATSKPCTRCRAYRTG